MDAERLARLAAYCRLDDLTESEKAVLGDMLNSAEAYLEQAGVAVPKLGTARRGQYDTVVNALVLSMWEQRGSQGEDVDLTENPVFRRQLTQLKLTQTPQSASLTGEP